MLAEETVRHRAAIALVTPEDRDAAAEVERHLTRVGEILIDHSRRTDQWPLGTPAPKLGGPAAAAGRREDRFGRLGDSRPRRVRSGGLYQPPPPHE